MRRLLSAVAALAGIGATFIIGAGAAPAQFEKTQLVGDESAGQPNTLNPMEIEVAPDGTVFYTERRGVLGAWDPETESARVIGTLPVTFPAGENGLMGIALDPDYASNGWIYLSYSVSPASTLTQRVSRFQLDGDGDLDLASEVPIFEWTHLREPDSCRHAAGALEFDPDGNLLITTGDNVNPFASQGYAPIDERPGREVWDAQRTSANTNDHNGKLLRITPNELITPGTEPGIGTTYSIPEGNMFPVGTEDTLPEIHSMGFRNPFRFKVDEETGWTLLADYGPDAGQGNPARGPQGSVEFNVIQEPINSGWPYCIRATVPYIDFDFETNQSGEPFDCENPVNDSPNNTGLTELPPTFPATMWQGFSETDPRYPGLGTNGAPMSGPRYYYDPSNPSPTKFPEEFDGKWFIASWNNDWIRTVDLDSEGTPSNVQNFPSLNYLSPMDMEFGPDGSLYLAEWGQGFDQDNPESGIYRIDHVGGVAPEVTASADPTSGTAPLEVSFDGEATNPDGSPNPNFEYEWDFDDGNTSTQEDPTHTYTEPGTYEATLTVTDPETDEQGTDTVQIRVEQSSSCPTGLSDEFDGTELDPKWEVVRRDDERLSVSDGALNLLAHPDDIFGTNNGNLANVVLQPLPGGGEEPWSITTELTWEPDTNFQNAGLMIYEDDDNYIKTGMVWNGARNFELVKETDANPTFPGGSTPAGSVGDTFFLRYISDDGNSVDAQFSADGSSWTDIGTTGTDLSGLTNPRIGVYATAAGAPEITASFHSVTFEPDVAGGAFGDEFDGASLDKTKWNSIVREQEDLYEVSDGQLHVLTVNGDIYEGGDPAPTRNFFLQTPDHAGADWTIETQVDASELSEGYEQAGLLAYEDDANYVKYDILSDDGQTVLNRIELRSEEGDVIQSPMPQVTSADPEGFPGVVWLRLTKTGDMYSGEYSFDGETFESLGEPVQNDMGAPRFGIYTLGQLSGGGTAHFEHFSIEGETPCPNEPPVIESVTADPDSGDAPLEVDFTAEASDPDGDDLTYEWDFDDGGTSNQQNPTHTYTDPGVYEAEVNVSDGEAQVSDPVTVTVTGGPEPRFRVLAFSETAGFRHTSIDEGHAALDALATEHDFAVDHTEDSSAFTEANLANYDTVAFLSTTGDVLDEAQQDAFEAYIQGGGGYTGIHSASDTEYTWPWYGDLVGGYFRNHPPGTPTATVRVEDHDHESTTGLPESYVKVDEWYNFQSPDNPVVGGGGTDYSPRGVAGIHVLANVDESTYDEQDGNATDDDHPVIWCQRYDGGRSWYTALGHTEASFLEAEFLQQVLGGLETTAGVEPSSTCGIELEPGEPDLTARVQPRREKVKLGRQARFEFTVRNRGDAAAEDVELCVRAPSRKVKILGAACRETPTLGKGASVDATFRLKPKRSAAGDRINVRFIVTAANADRASDSASLKVEKKKRGRRR